MEACRSVGRTRPACRHHDAWASRQLSPGLCRHCRPAFLAAGGDLDRRTVKRVEQREVTLAWHAESTGHAVPLQGIGQDPAAGPGCRHGMSVRSSGATNLAGLKLSYKSGYDGARVSSSQIPTSGAPTRSRASWHWLRGRHLRGQTLSTVTTTKVCNSPSSSRIDTYSPGTNRWLDSLKPDSSPSSPSIS